jgi:hypothetical protein
MHDIDGISEGANGGIKQVLAFSFSTTSATEKFQCNADGAAISSSTFGIDRLPPHR